MPAAQVQQLRISQTIVPCRVALQCVWLVATFFIALCAFPATPGKLDEARKYYEQAKTSHAAVMQTPVGQRTEADYARVIAAFRRVYLTAPTYGNNTICLMAIGELYEEAARRFHKPRHFESAIESYEFLLREYPNSQFRFDAMLSVARVYREDLLKPEEALKQYERYLKAYPRSAQARQVQVAIAQIRDQVGSPAEPSAQTIQAVAPTAVAKNNEVAAPPPMAQPERAAKPKPTNTLAAVSDIRYWATPGYSRVVVDVEERVNYEVGRLSDPTRLFVDLQNTKVIPPKGMTLPVDDDLLKRVRLAQFKPGVSRVVLDLGEMDTYEVFELTNPYRLVIDVHGDVHGAEKPAVAVSATLLTAKTEKSVPSPQGTDPAPAVAAVTPPAPGPVAQAQVVTPAPKPSAPLPAASAHAKEQAKEPVKEKTAPVEAAKAAPAKSAPAPAEIAKATPAPPPDKIKPAQPIRGGPHSLTRALGLKIGRILLDPGHGGHDTGTIGPSGLTEKELTLDLAQRVGKLIEERLGSEVAYTREKDSFVPLEERAALANKAQADLFLSIHANSSRIKRAMGVETYYLSLTNDKESLEVAARENAVSQETISQLQGLVEKIALNEKMDESKEFATRVQSALGKGLATGKAGQFNRGVKKAPFVVLIGANMPSVLAEVSFLSNPDEEKKLKTAEHRQKIAEALYKGIESYVGTMSGVKVAKSEPTHTASVE